MLRTGETPQNPSANVAAKAAAHEAGEGGSGMDELERSIGDLVIANRILAKEDVVDAYGHVSIRHPAKPDHYLLSRSLSPEFVTRDDIIEFKLDGTPVSDTRPAYLERFIHGAIYEARPEINAVIHSHAEDVLPFSISKTPMCCVAHVASDMGSHVPVWDIADKFGDATNLLVDQHGAGPRHGEEARQELGGADARPRLLGGGRRPAQAGAAVGLPAAQRPHPAGRDADGRVQGDVGGRDQDPQQLPRRLAGNAARLGVLGASAPAAATCSADSKGGV